MARQFDLSLVFTISKGGAFVSESDSHMLNE
jgi:hypothetical protein